MVKYLYINNYFENSIVSAMMLKLSLIIFTEHRITINYIYLLRENKIGTYQIVHHKVI